MKKLILLIPLGLFVFTLSGCVVALGNRDLGHPHPTSATLGQQLTDLKKARDNGALSEDEYQAQRKKLMEERTGK